MTYSCNSKNSKANIRINAKDSNDVIASYKNDDKEMNSAILLAKASFPSFLDVLKKGCNNCEKFNIKIRVAFSDNSGEHLWVDSLHFENNKLAGILASIPEKVDRLKLGDLIFINQDSVSDWMYIQNGKLIGGYTIKVVYDELDDSAKKEMERDLGAKIR